MNWTIKYEEIESLSPSSYAKLAYLKTCFKSSDFCLKDYKLLISIKWTQSDHTKPVPIDLLPKSVSFFKSEFSSSHKPNCSGSFDRY